MSLNNYNGQLELTMSFISGGIGPMMTQDIQDNHVHISISDKGLGIPEKDLPFIFERYRRGTNISTIEGSGIGLHLVKTIIDLHGGKVTVRSEENKGSIFNISIPLIKVIE